LSQPWRLARWCDLLCGGSRGWGSSARAERRSPTFCALLLGVAAGRVLAEQAVGSGCSPAKEGAEPELPVGCASGHVLGQSSVAKAAAALL